MAQGDSTKLVIELQVLLRNLNQVLRGLDRVKSKLESVANIRVNQRSNENVINRQRIASERLALAQQRLQLQQQRLAVQSQELANRQERARQASDRLARSSERLKTSLSGQERILKQTQQRLNTISAAALRVGGGLRSLGLTVSVGLTGPLTALGIVASRSAADIDSIRNRLIATEGSLEAANRRLEQLRRLADESIGVTRRSALDTFATLSVVGDITEDTINQQIKALGRLNAAFTIDDQQQFFRNLVQIFTQGFERADIKEALGRVPIFEQLLQQAFGTADRERLRELKASGKLTLDTFLSGLADAVNTDPTLARIGESIRTRFQKTFERLTDALEPLGRAILGPLERIVTAVEPIILRIADAFNRLPPGIQTAIVAVGILVAALGPVLFIIGGLASGIGALGTALATIIPLLGSVGLPVILAVLTAIAGQLTAIIGIVVLVGRAWQTNFLGIRQIAANTANGIVTAFNRIRAVIEDAVRRVLPTLESITKKVVGAVQGVWEQYGKTVIEVVGRAFNFVLDITVVFLKQFGNFVDLVLKLIDGDWRGAFQAFARIVITAIDEIGPLFTRFANAFRRAFLTLNAFIIRQAVRFADAGARLAANLIIGLSAGLIAGSPQISNALAIMLLTAIASVTLGPIAQVFIARFLAELRKAAAEGIPGALGPQVGGEPVLGRLLEPARVKRPSLAQSPDEKGENVLRRQLDRLREARDKLAEAQEESQLALLRSRIDTEFEATKAGLDRELTALEANFDDRLVALRKYFAERRSLEEAQIDAEIQKELELTSVLFSELSSRRRAAEREFHTELVEIDRNPKLKGQAREAAIQTAELKKAADLEKALSEFKIKHGESTARVTELERKRQGVLGEILRLEARLTEEIEKQKAQLQFDLFEEQGRTADAEAGRLKARFTETLRDLRIDITGLGGDLQTALNRVDLTVLQQRLDDLPEPIRTLIELLDIGVKRAQIAEASRLVDDLSAGLRLDEQRIQNQVLDGLISQREAQEQILVKQREYRALLLDILKGELQKAKLIKDQGLIVSLEAQIAEVERLGIAIDEFGQEINRALFSDLQSGLSGIFSGARRGFEGLRDAAVSFGERLLDTLNDIAATSILQQIEGLFKPDAQNTQGTIGGFFSKLFGLAPKQAADAATASATLQTGATTAAATFSTGVATSATGFGTTVVTAATSFASLIVSAGAAFAAAVGIGSAGEAVGGIGTILGGAAATGLFPAVPGGVYKFVEGGYPEAVLTTDPKHASRQLAILRAFLRETKGLGGRIKGFAAGAMLTPTQIEANLLSGISSMPLTNGNIGEFAVAGTPSMMKLRQILVDERDVGNWVNSPEGERVLVDFLTRNQPVVRKLSGK